MTNKFLCSNIIAADVQIFFRNLIDKSLSTDPIQCASKNLLAATFDRVTFFSVTQKYFVKRMH